MAEAEHCSVAGCEQLAAAPLETHSFCWEHFISTCDEQLDEYRYKLEERPFQETTAESLRHFLNECRRQAADLAHNVGEPDNPERARLLNILLRAADLGRHLRRSPRKVASVPVWLRCEGPGRTWEEETETQVLSRYGAGLECRHFVAAGGTLAIVRRDSGQRVSARVAYCRYNPGGCREIGVEFLSGDNFWDIDWDLASPTRSQHESLSQPPDPARSQATPEDPQRQKSRCGRGRENALAEILVAHERQLWEAIKKNDRNALENLMADDLLWVSGGGADTKSPALERLSEIYLTDDSLDDFKVTKLNKAASVVTFKAVNPGSNNKQLASTPTYHTSIWIKNGGKWRVVFHQQTPAGKETERPAISGAEA